MSVGDLNFYLPPSTLRLNRVFQKSVCRNKNTRLLLIYYFYQFVNDIVELRRFIESSLAIIDLFIVDSLLMAKTIYFSFQGGNGVRSGNLVASFFNIYYCCTISWTTSCSYWKNGKIFFSSKRKTQSIFFS